MSVHDAGTRPAAFAHLHRRRPRRAGGLRGRHQGRGETARVDARPCRRAGSLGRGAGPHGSRCAEPRLARPPRRADCAAQSACSRIVRGPLDTMPEGIQNMLFNCLPDGAPIPGRFPGPAHARGKWFIIDIHCHVTSIKAAAMVEGNQAVSRWFLETQASPNSQEINRRNGVRTRLQGTSAEQRLADMDLMGIDIQAISPAPRQTYYGTDPDLGLATARTLNDEIA